MKSISLVVVLILGITSSKSQVWQWARQVVSPHNNSAQSITSDDAGNIFVAGSFIDTILIDTTELISANTSSIYIYKYDAIGNLIWATIAAGGPIVQVTGINVDHFGNIFITGQFNSIAFFGEHGTDTLISIGDFDVFIAKYNSTGNLMWAESTGGSGYDYSAGISSDTNGNNYITGEYHITQFPYSSSKIFIAKYDSIGNNAWLKQTLHYISTDFAEGIVTDDNGTSFITGQFFDTLIFDSTALLVAGNVEANMFVGKFNTDGMNSWLQKAGAASGYCGGIGIDIDEIDNVYLTGFFHGSIYFGTINLTGLFGVANEVFISKCDSNANYKWAMKTTGLGQGRDVTVQPGGDIFFSGYFTEDLIAGTDTFLNNNSTKSIFILDVDSSGVFRNAIQLCGNHDVALAGICNAGSDLYVAGSFFDTLAFNASLQLTTNGEYNSFLVKLNLITGIEEEDFSKDEVIVYPNPATSQFKIIFPETGNFSSAILNIFDLEGKLIYSTQEASKEVQINLPSGVYVLKISSGNLTWIKKLIIL